MIDGFQSQKELFFKGNIDQTLAGQDLSIFTYGTKILVKAGMAAAGGIPVRLGDQLSLGFFAEDPDGSTIRSDGFVAYINGQINPSVIIQGSGPFYRNSLGSPDLGDYNLRLKVSDLDGASGFSQPLLIQVAAGFEPTIKMVSPVNESLDYVNETPVTEYAFRTPLPLLMKQKTLTDR